MSKYNFKKGDMCFILDRNNKIKHCHVISALPKSSNNEYLYQVQDLIDWRYIVIEEKYCAIKKIDLTGVKRQQ